jgi:ABC-2 type transport system ATP-binding protein
MNRPAAVEIQSLSLTYPPARRGGTGRSALRNISFGVREGEIFGLLGPNGGGKTTLFKILSTLLKPSSGSARIGGLDVQTDPREIRRHLGVAFQAPSLDKKLTAEENLRHQGHLYGLRGTALNDRISDMLRRLNLEDRSRELVETLSGGMCRRVELAKALLPRPKVLLLDEPSTGLDPGARRDLWTQLKSLRDERDVTVLLSTHLTDEAADCDRLVLLHEGEVVALGSPDQLTSEIGGDILTVHTRQPEHLLSRIQTRFGVAPTPLDGNIRIEIQAAHRFIPQLVEAFPGEISAVSLGKPTLEDVFIRRTGHKFWDEPPV